MRISINLATRPFTELRPLFARLRLAMAALALLAIGLGVGLYFLSARARTAKAQMDELKRQTEAFQQERQTNETRMLQPENSGVLDRAKFLNTLFASKSFSWTSVMMDLEQVLPAGVQVTSIEPVVTAEGDVNIHLRVSGPRDLAVDLVRNLEHSQRFLMPRLANETSQTTETGRLVPVMQTGVPGGVEFDILSGYNPLPAEKKPTVAKDAVRPSGSETAMRAIHPTSVAGAAAAGKPNHPVQPIGNGGGR